MKNCAATKYIRSVYRRRIAVSDVVQAADLAWKLLKLHTDQIKVVIQCCGQGHYQAEFRRLERLGRVSDRVFRREVRRQRKFDRFQNYRVRWIP